ncbi:MAG: hypothetical protein V7776_15750 [Halopseudomonas aestusnigri]
MINERLIYFPFFQPYIKIAMRKSAISIFHILLALIVLKIGLLFFYGPVFTPDSYGYVAFAKIILTGNSWLYFEDLNNYWYPETSFRIIGYPLIIALAEAIFGNFWQWVVIIFQISISTIASWFIYRLVKCLSGNLYCALFVAFSHGLGQGLVLDLSILTDSLNASLLLIVSCYLGIAIIDEKKISLLVVSSLGVLVLFAFLLREAGSYFQIIFWPLVFYWGYRSKGWLKGLALSLVFIAPLLIGIEAYKTWNNYRTGERFVTTASQTSMFFPTLDLEKRGVSVLADDPLLKDMAPLSFSDDRPPLTRVALINKHLVETQSFNAYDVGKYGMTRFFRNWAEHPVDMLAVSLSQISEKYLFLAFMPVESLTQLHFWAGGENTFSANKKKSLWSAVFAEGRIDLLGLRLGRGVSRIISIIIMLSFLALMPIFLFSELRSQNYRIKKCNPKIMVMSFYYLSFFCYLFAYSMVSLEKRYLMPVEPLSIVVGVTLFVSTIQSYLKKRGIRTTLKD